MQVLHGLQVDLRPAQPTDIVELVRIRERPEVRRYWRGGDDLIAAVEEDLVEEGATSYVVEIAGEVIGWIQWSAEDEPDYRCAFMDIYLDPDFHGRGLGSDALRTLARHLINEHGYHRLEIDPAVDNVAAIACYQSLGFKEIGIRRRSERGEDGVWHDALLLDLLAEELTDGPPRSPVQTAPLPTDSPNG